MATLHDYPFRVCAALVTALMMTACNLRELTFPGSSAAPPTPSATATVSPLPSLPTETATLTETPGPSPTPERARCDLFAGMDIKFITLDWEVGKRVIFYLRMPGGVPGLERPIQGDSELWEYSAKFGAFTTHDCEYIAGYAERLYCEVSIPPEFGNTSQTLELYLNGCEAPVYTHLRANVPEYPATPTSEPDCAEYTEADACSDAGCVWDPGDNVCE